MVAGGLLRFRPPRWSHAAATLLLRRRRQLSTAPSPAMEAELIVRGGTVVTAADTCQADVVVSDGVVTAVTAHGAVPPADGITEVDAVGKLVIPGGVDSHCHIEQTREVSVGCHDVWDLHSDRCGLWSLR